ncbi:MAG: hypothetical protein IMZ61_00250 [Planctomycetes bacterium]|nr:hypothetical protein [Thermoplasmata archaeon]MBE3142348.1 hypothetical protein [Planctomycetota bacterium]
MRLNSIYTIKTKARALKAWAADDKVHVVVNEQIFHGKETYIMSFDVSDLINLGLLKVKNSCK